MLGARTIFLNRRHRWVGVHVTSTRAIAQFTHGITHIRILEFLMRPGFIVIRVATGAVGLVGCSRVGGDFGISRMTSRAEQVAAMVERLIRQAHVGVHVRNPRIGHVADFTWLRRCEMSRILAGRRFRYGKRRNCQRY